MKKKELRKRWAYSQSVFKKKHQNMQKTTESLEALTRYSQWNGLLAITVRFWWNWRVQTRNSRLGTKSEMLQRSQKELKHTPLIQPSVNRDCQKSRKSVFCRFVGINDQTKRIESELWSKWTTPNNTQSFRKTNVAKKEEQKQVKHKKSCHFFILLGDKVWARRGTDKG